MRRLCSAISIAVTCLAVSCKSSDSAAHAEPTKRGAHATEADAGANDAAADHADAPIRGVLREVVGWLNGATFDPDTYAARFTPEAVRSLSFEGIKDAFDQIRGDSWTIERVQEVSATQLVAGLYNGDARLMLTLVVTAEDPPKIAGLLLQPEIVPPKTSTEAVARLRSFGPLSLLAAETGDGTCQPLLMVDAERTRPIGSAFKLYVLAALAKDIREGKRQWSDAVAIRDELDSLPSGKTQDEPAGSTLSVRELASRMISQSDNTATDHVIAFVGREAVEQAVVDSGHAHPELNRPFLTTREAFILKFGADEGLRRDYLAADEAGRRALLGSRVAAAPLPTAPDVVPSPRLIEELEWFASPVDLCNVLVPLSSEMDAREILAINPGVPGPAGRWSYLGYKGGSEPGVLTMAWAYETAREKYVFAASVANPSEAFAEYEPIQLMAAIRDFTPRFDE